MPTGYIPSKVRLRCSYLLCNIWGCMCPPVPFKFMWSIGYICNQSEYHLQICAWRGCTIVFYIYILYIFREIWVLFPSILCSLWCVPSTMIPSYRPTGLCHDSEHIRDAKSHPFISSPPGAAYMRQWTGSSLVQVMACRLNQFWFIVNGILANKFHLNRNSIIFVQENAFENAVCQNSGHFVQGKMS